MGRPDKVCKIKYLKVFSGAAYGGWSMFGLL